MRDSPFVPAKAATQVTTDGRARLGPRFRGDAVDRACVTLTVILAAPLRSPLAGQAQDYPNRPVRAIVAVGAGGTGDVFARVLGEQLHKRWGQPLVIENRPGAQSNIGARACAEAPPDGYTLCIMPGEPLAYNQHLFKKLPFDPVKDFQPITNLFFNFAGAGGQRQAQV